MHYFVLDFFIIKKEEMKNKDLIPILVKIDSEYKIVYKDVSMMNAESLIKLKKCFRGIHYDSTLAIDNIIKNNIKSSTNINYKKIIRDMRIQKKENKKLLLKKKSIGRKQW